jgi:NAD(P)-dependent dehydrogenase (short-subunit alcohol dehydrogenase family)
MTGKTVLVTGGTSGIGRATAEGLSLLGADVAITGRAERRTQEVARDISSASGVPVMAFAADLSSQARVRRLAEEVLQALPRIDVLVNDAGGYWSTRHVTADGSQDGSTSTTSRASGATPGRAPTTSPSSPPSCSPTSSPEGWPARRSPPTRSIQESSAPPSAGRTRDALSACWSR